MKKGVRSLAEWAMFGIAMACFAAVFPFALRWEEPAAAALAAIASVLSLAVAAASIFSHFASKQPSSRIIRSALFIGVTSMMLAYFEADSPYLVAGGIILALCLSETVRLIEENIPGNSPCLEIFSTILLIFIFSVAVAAFHDSDVNPGKEAALPVTVSADAEASSASENASVLEETAHSGEDGDISKNKPSGTQVNAEEPNISSKEENSTLDAELLLDAFSRIFRASRSIDNRFSEASEAIIDEEAMSPAAIAEPEAELPVDLFRDIFRSARLIAAVRSGSASPDAEAELPENEAEPEAEPEAELPVDIFREIFANAGLIAEAAGLRSVDDIIKDEAVLPEESGKPEAELPVSDEYTYSEDDFFAGLSPEEAAFWSEFYIAGEDELQLEDGFYFMDLYINGSYTGVVETEIRSGRPYLSAVSLRNFLSSSITREALDRIFMNEDSYLSLDYLSSVGVGTAFNSADYRVDLTFSTIDMPVQILSIRSATPRIQSRPISGAVNIDPAVFTLASEYSLSIRVPNFLRDGFWNDLRYNFTVKNRARLFDVFLDFTYYLDWTHKEFDFSLGSYRFYMDFPDQMIRLSWGNVNTSLLSPEGTAFGIRFDKSLSYADSTYTRGSSYEQLIEVPSQSVVTIYNNGDGRPDNQIYRRTLDPGVYRLRDFILYSGANRILIRIEPLDGTPVREFVMDVNYSASLLQPGETYYGASFTTGRIERNDGDYKHPTTVSIPLWNGRRADYDWRNLTLEGNIRTGILSNLTGDFSLAVQNLPNEYAGFRFNTQAAVELTHENIIGTTRYNINIYEYADDYGEFTTPYFRLRIGHQSNTGWRPVNSVTFSLGYDSPRDNDYTKDHDLSLDLGLSGSHGILAWSASAYLSTDVTDWNEFSWSTLLSASLYFSGNISMNASMNISGGIDEAPSVSGRVGLTFRFGRNTIYASATESSATLDYDYYDDRNSVSATVDASSYTSLSGLGLSASYTYSGDVFKVNADLSSRGITDSLSSSLRVTTASVFADGYLAFTSSIPNNFILIHQADNMNRNKLSVGAVNTSTPNRVPTLFGTGLYTGVTSPSSLMIYSEGDSVFSPLYSEAVNLLESKRTGYVMTIRRDEVFSVSGTVELSDGTPWINGASPLYKAVLEDGRIAVESTDMYIFTDSDGRFVATELPAGFWAFDVSDGSGWNLYIFETGESGAPSAMVKVLDNPGPADYSADEIYSAVYAYTEGSYMNDAAFFSMLYPEEAV